jgi:hypothetical protein
MHRSPLSLLVALACLVACLPGCGGDSSSADQPKGCRTGGTATGSFVAACNACAFQNCNTELVNQVGPGWTQQVFGGSQACGAFYGCLCNCYTSGACNLSACLDSGIDAPCQAAMQAAQICLSTKCATECN